MDRKLTNTKNCLDCLYCLEGRCFVDKHEVVYKEQAYSCKYYKKYKKENKEDEGE